MTAAWKKLRFILSVRSDFHIIDSLLIAVHAFVNLVSMSFSVDSTLLPTYVNLSTMSQILNKDYLKVVLSMIKILTLRYRIIILKCIYSFNTLKLNFNKLITCF